jgi:GNAT superfamily N-acetyltransferase
MRVAFVTPLNEQHDLTSFSCGDDPWDVELNGFLFENALSDQRERYNKTYLFVDEDHVCVGFVTVLAGQTSTRESRLQALMSFGKPPPYVYAPALHVGRIAVRDGFQGEGNGLYILGWVRHLARDLTIGCRFIALDVDARNIHAIRFYEREGFWMISQKPKKNGMLLMLYDLVASEAK